MSVTAIEEVTPARRFTLPSDRSYEKVDDLVTAPLIEREAWSWRISSSIDEIRVPALPIPIHQT